MAEKEKNYMPVSTAGLVRYFDEEEKGIKLKPSMVVWMAVIFSGLVLAMKFIG
jgi:preprotein translocase subunit Sec61beta